MKMILDVTLPHEPFNAAVRDGTIGTKLNKIVETTKPEAMYFTEQDGHRGAVIIIEMANASDMPAFVEPWMLLFQADIKFRPAMTPDDLKRAGLDALSKKWS